MRGICLLLLLLAALPATAQDKPTVLLVDDTLGTVSGSRARLGFERMPVGEEDDEWDGPDFAAAGITLLAGGGLIGSAVGEAYAQGERNETIQPLRTAVEQDKRLHGAVLAALRAVASTHGMGITDTFMAQPAAAGAVAKFGTAGGAALMVARNEGPLVSLSWDDRFPALALDIRRYRMSRTGTGLLPREEAKHALRFVGHPAPATAGAVDYWSAEGGKRFLAEIDTGLAAVLPLAWDESVEVPSVKRRERVTLRIDGNDWVFPGRLWKQEGGLAYLFNSDEGITVVHVQPPAQAIAGATP